MAFDLADWTITRNAGNLDVRYVGDSHIQASPSYATTIELHRGLQALADDAEDTGDDELSIIDQTPSDRGGADTNISLINGCNLTAADIEHIYDGSLTQAGGDEIYDGIQVFGNATNIQIIQASGTDAVRIDNDFWNEPKMIAATSDAASGTSHRFLVNTRTGGADIDGRRLLGTQRELGTVYTEFFIGGGTNRGNNVLALTANSDLNNQTAELTIAGWDTIVNDTEGFNAITVGGTAFDFYSNWEFGSQGANDFYERAKWIQMRVGDIGAGGDTRDPDQILYGLDGDIFRGITHAITIDNPAGTFVEPEKVTWTGGSGQLLAIDSTTAGTEMWIQLLTGTAPADGVTITGAGGGTADVNVTVTSKTVSLPFVGASTGSAIIGAYGLGIGNDDLTQNERLIALDDTLVTPPNNVTYTVSNLQEDDYVITGPDNGGDFEFDQLGQNAAVNGAAVTSLVMDSVIPTDIPASGTIRCLNSSGRYVRVPYSSFSGSTFTIPSYDFSGVGDDLEAGANVFVTYLDKVVPAATPSESVVYVFDTSRVLFTRVRNAGTGASTSIKTFETTATVGSGGGSSTVGRIDDF